MRKKNIRIGNTEACLGVERPDIAKEWHPMKNGTLTVANVRCRSGFKVWWRCEKGHEWEQTVHNRVNHNSRCPYCANRKVCADNNLAVRFPEIAKEWHPTKNEKSPTDYLPGTERKAWWLCLEGHEYESAIGGRTGPPQAGCPFCKESHGEKAVESVLLAQGIEYVREHRFPDCKFKRELPFDFYLPQNKAVIEFHGVQHYRSAKFYGGEERFRHRRMLDGIKEEYCKESGLAYLAIPWNKIKSVTSIVTRFLSKHR